MQTSATLSARRPAAPLRQSWSSGTASFMFCTISIRGPAVDVDAQPGGWLACRPVAHVMVVKELRGERADQGHVVGIGERAAVRTRLALAPQLGDGSGLEHAGLRHARLMEHFIDVFGPVCADERERVRRAVGLFSAGQDLFGNEAGGGALEYVLFVEHAQLVFGRQRVGERDHVFVEKWKTR